MTTLEFGNKASGIQGGLVLLNPAVGVYGPFRSVLRHEFSHFLFELHEWVPVKGKE